MRTASLLALLASARGIWGICTQNQCADAITSVGVINVGLQSRSIDCAKFLETTVTPNASFVNSESQSSSWLTDVGLLWLPRVPIWKIIPIFPLKQPPRPRKAQFQPTLHSVPTMEPTHLPVLVRPSHNQRSSLQLQLLISMINSLSALIRKHVRKGTAMLLVQVAQVSVFLVVVTMAPDSVSLQAYAAKLAYIIWTVPLESVLLILVVEARVLIHRFNLSPIGLLLPINSSRKALLASVILLGSWMARKENYWVHLRTKSWAISLLKIHSLQTSWEAGLRMGGLGLSGYRKTMQIEWGGNWSL